MSIECRFVGRQQTSRATARLDDERSQVGNAPSAVRHESRIDHLAQGLVQNVAPNVGQNVPDGDVERAAGPAGPVPEELAGKIPVVVIFFIQIIIVIAAVLVIVFVGPGGASGTRNVRGR